MLTISKPLSIKKIDHVLKYYTLGTWHGKLASEWGLRGEVDPKVLEVLLQGFTPDLKHRVPPSRNPNHMSRRCAFDLTLSAPKSVSLAACDPYLGPLIEKAHQTAVSATLDAVEQYTQTRETTRRKDIVTRKWVAALYQHNETRGVVQGDSNPTRSSSAAPELVQSPQLHTHCLLVNMTQAANNDICAVDPIEIYQSCAFGTAIYRMILTEELQKLGISIEIQNETFCPEIKDFPLEYTREASVRSAQIDQAVEKLQMQTPLLGTMKKVRAFLAHKDRRGKHEIPEDMVIIPPKTFMERLDEKYGNHIRLLSEKVRRAHLNKVIPEIDQILPRSVEVAQEAATYSRRLNTEKEAVFDHRAFVIEAVKYGIGRTTLNQIGQEFKKNLLDRTIHNVESQKRNDPGYWYTTRTMLKLEKRVCDFVSDTRNTQVRLLSPDTINRIIEQHPTLNENQRRVLTEISANTDRVQAINGVAGAGKSYVVNCLQQAAQLEGYQLLGFAPTTRAAKILSEVGLTSTTLQAFIVRRDVSPGQKRLLILDESSLAETRNIDDLFQKLHPQDRLLFLGDTRQLESIGAGTPFAQLQEHGMATSQMDEIVRQREDTAPQLRKEVELLYQNKPEEALESIIARRGVIQVSGDSTRAKTLEEKELKDRQQLWKTATASYLQDPENTIVIAPSNLARRQINKRVHEKLVENQVVTDPIDLVTLDNRFDLSGEDRVLAGNYSPRDILRFSKRSILLGVRQGEYAVVESVNSKQNTITIRLEESGQLVTYNPKWFKGVTAYREDTKKTFGINELIQFTAPNHRLKISNRELGVIQDMGDEFIEIKLSEKNKERTVKLTYQEARHIDHGYAVTAVSAQGQTQKKAYFVVDSQDNELLVNRRAFYVALSRATHHAKILTNNIEIVKELLVRKRDKAQAQKQYRMLNQSQGLDPKTPIDPAIGRRL